MKKILLAVVALCAVSAGYSNEGGKEARVRIETSCGVVVEMIYESGKHTGQDVANDALILDAEFCGKVNKSQPKP